MNYLKLFAVAAFAIGAILYLASADDYEVVVGDQDYDLDKYVKISVNISTDMKIKAGEDYGLNIKADEKDLKNIQIYVKGHTLVIKNKRTFNSSWHGDRPEITITMPMLKKFTLNGTSDVEIEGVHGKFFMVVMNGSGSIDFEGASNELRAEINGTGSLTSESFAAEENMVVINGSGSVAMAGKCITLDVEINGSGDFDGKDYKCSEVEIDIIGSGDLDVYATEVLLVDVMGSGDVNAYGNPKKVKEFSRKKNHITIR